MTQGSTIRIVTNTYSVPSRLIGEQVDVHVMAEYLEVWLGPAPVERVPRPRGRHKHSINYRHVIDWLVRKPGAFGRIATGTPCSRRAGFAGSMMPCWSMARPVPPRITSGSWNWRPRSPRPGSTRSWAGSWSGTCRSHRPSSRSICVTTGPAAGDGGDRLDGGFVDLRPVPRNPGGFPITRPSDVHESLTDCSASSTCRRSDAITNRRPSGPVKSH